MRRRGFLALLSVGTVGLAGCTSSCTDSYAVELVSVDTADIVSRSVLSVPGAFDRYEEFVLRKLAADPEAPSVALPRHRIREDAVVELDDTYYRVRQERVTRDGYRVSRTVTLPGDGTSVDAQYTDLPAVDREAVLASGLGTDLLDGTVEDRREFVTSNTENGDLVLSLRYLTPDPETPLATAGRLFVDFEGLTLSVGLRSNGRTPVDTDRLTATEVGTTTGAAAEAVLSAEGVRLDESSMSERDREFLDGAVESEQTICLRNDETSSSVEAPALSASLRESLGWYDYLWYDGQWYAVEARETVD